MEEYCYQNPDLEEICENDESEVVFPPNCDASLFDQKVYNDSNRVVYSEILYKLSYFTY